MPSRPPNLRQHFSARVVRRAAGVALGVVLLAAACHPRVAVAAETTVPAATGIETATKGPKPSLRPFTHGMRPQSAAADSGAQARLHLASISGARAIVSRPHAGTAQPAEVVIDVMVAYTAKASRHYADITRNLIDPAFEVSNVSFEMSGIGHVKLRLVHAYQTDYAETNEHFDHVWRLADRNDGYMEEVHALRDRYRADVVVLIVDEASNGCGQATRIRADAEEAFAVVHHACAVENYTLAHEIGHLLGASHDRGYTHGSEWRDIMSNKTACNGCPRLPIWSSPAVLVRGTPAGSARLDNAAVIAANAARVAAFR